LFKQDRRGAPCGCPYANHGNVIYYKSRSENIDSTSWNISNVFFRLIKKGPAPGNPLIAETAAGAFYIIKLIE